MNLFHGYTPTLIDAQAVAVRNYIEVRALIAGPQLDAHLQPIAVEIITQTS